MNYRTFFVLLAISTTVSTLAISSAYAQVSCPNCELDDPRGIAKQLLMRDLPLSLWIDKSMYAHGDTIKVGGHVASVISGTPVTLTVRNSLNSVIAIDQIPVNENGDFSTTFNTKGSLWKLDGDYRIKASYGSNVKSNQVLFEIIGGMVSEPTKSKCAASELSIEGMCVPFTISDGTVTGVSVNPDDKSLIIMISANKDGTFTISPSKEVLTGAFMVLVDGEEWDDAEITGKKITVNFFAGTEKIEIFGTHVIPEFGAIAALILAVAIISIIAVSSKSRLSIMSRY